MSALSLLTHTRTPSTHSNHPHTPLLFNQVCRPYPLRGLFHHPHRQQERATVPRALDCDGGGGKNDDVFSTNWDNEKPISGGLLSVKAGGPFTYTYGYNELKLIVEGTLILEDKTTGVKIVGVPGDTLSIPKGTPVTFSSPNFGKAFYVGQRKLRDW